MCHRPQLINLHSVSARELHSQLLRAAVPAMQTDEVPYAQRPDSLKKLRACRTCKLVKTYDQFYHNYCENCPQVRPDAGTAGRRNDYVLEHTTNDFEGVVAMMQPDHSWVARWLRMHHQEEGHVIPFKPGVYAISLPGEELRKSSGGAGEEEEDEYEEEEEAAAAATGGVGKRGSAAGGLAASSENDYAVEEQDEEEEAAAAAARKARLMTGGTNSMSTPLPDRDDPEAREAAVNAGVIAPDDSDSDY